MRRQVIGLLTLAVVLLTLFGCGGNPKPSENGSVSGTLNGSGATFPKPFYDLAIETFEHKNIGATITYAGGGSGKGRTDLQNQLVDFAGSDAPVKDSDKASYKGGEFLYFPTVAAPITVSYNLDTKNLNLSADTIAKIFQRQITKWNDPAILAENSGAALTGDITVVHRSDGSGTTENFTKFLSKASTLWNLKSGSTVEWPSSTQAANGNTGVAQAILQTKGSIGYVDLSDADALGLKYANVENKAGRFIKADLAGASAALAAAPTNADLTYDPIYTEGANAYPITAPTWIIVYAKQTNQVRAETLKAFLTFLLVDGQKFAETVEFAPLPTTLANQALAQVAKITVV